MEKVKVSREVAELLDAQSRDEWSKQFHLISHCKGYTGNGIRCGSIYTQEFKALEALQPLDYAKCMIVGYEVAEKNPDPLQNTDPPYSPEDYEDAKRKGYDLDDWDEYCKYYGVGEDESYDW